MARTFLTAVRNAVILTTLVAACDSGRLTETPLKTQHDVDVGVDVGSALVTVTYLGQPISVAFYGPYANLSGPNGNFTFSSSISSIPVGTYTLTYGNLAPAVTVTIVKGQTVTHNFEIAGSVGMLTGKVTVNGGLPTSGMGACASTSTNTCAGFDATGTFRMLLPAGAANGSVYANGCACYPVKNFSSSVTAGQTTDLGTIAIDNGSVDVAVTYLGQPITAAFYGPYANLSGPNGNYTFSGHIGNVPVGTYTLTYGNLAPPTEVTVVASQTVQHTFEISNTVGMVTGTVTVNGGPPTSGMGACISTSSNTCAGFDATGTFKMLLPTGTGSGFIYANGCACYPVKQFSVSVGAGQTTNIGNIAIDNGSVDVDVTYLNQPITAAFYGPYANLAGPNGNFTFSGHIGNVPVGTYTLTYGNLAPPVSVTVTTGNTVHHTFDISTTVGMLVGKVTINGAPPASGHGVCASTSTNTCAGFAPDGTFKMLLPAGNGSGSVYSNGCACYPIAHFTFGVTAGVTTDVGDPVSGPPNVAPTAHAGADRTAALNGSRSVSVTLDASASTDDGHPGPLSYTWSENGSTVATAATATVSLGIGQHTLHLKVDDGQYSSEDDVVITVVDPSPPTVVGTAGGPTGDNGWFVGNVTVSFAVSDAESDVTSNSCTPVSVTVDVANQDVTCNATSAGGSSSKTVSVKRDATLPDIAFTGNLGTYAVDQVVAITCSASDALSQLATSTCPQVNAPAYSLGAGAHTLQASARDKAGNTATASATYTVTVSTSGICQLAKTFVAKNNGASTAVCAKLKDNQLPALRAQLENQRGKWYSSADTDVLLSLIAAL